LRIIDKGLEKSLVMTGDLGLDLLTIVAFCLIAGFGIALDTSELVSPRRA
jgi:hypothetical protein